jgi:hypothetical protein
MVDEIFINIQTTKCPHMSSLLISQDLSLFILFVHVGNTVIIHKAKLR